MTCTAWWADEQYQKDRAAFYAYTKSDETLARMREFEAEAYYANTTDARKQRAHRKALAEEQRHG